MQVPEGYKVCSKCGGDPQPLEDFNWYTASNGEKKRRPECKSCSREMCRQYKARNRGKIADYNKTYKAEHREEISVYNHEYNKANREAIQKRQNKQHHERKKADPNYRITCYFRSKLNSIIKGKSRDCASLVECSYQSFKEWLTLQFEPDMSFDNYGIVWSIDHVNPCSNFDLTDDDNVYVCFHWSNLKPVYIMDNYKKNGKIIKSEIKEQEKIANLFVKHQNQFNPDHDYEIIEI